jgi:hypothetical protein
MTDDAQEPCVRSSSNSKGSTPWSVSGTAPKVRGHAARAGQDAALVRAVAVVSNAVVCSSVNVVADGANTDTPTST